jgi:hypothetical protein
MNIEKSSYKLKLEDHFLDDNKAIHSEGLVDGSIVSVDFTNFKIKLRSGGKTEEVSVDPDSLVESLREIVREKFGIEEHIGYSLKKGGVALPDEKTIHAAGIKSGEIIDVDHTEISVNVKTPSGEVVEVTIDPDNKVKTIKDKVKAKKGIEITGYHLKLDEKTLDDEKTIAKEGIYPSAELTMDYKEISIIVDI